MNRTYKVLRMCSNCYRAYYDYGYTNPRLCSECKRRV